MKVTWQPRYTQHNAQTWTLMGSNAQGQQHHEGNRHHSKEAAAVDGIQQVHLYTELMACKGPRATGKQLTSARGWGSQLEGSETPGGGSWPGSFCDRRCTGCQGLLPPLAAALALSVPAAALNFVRSTNYSPARLRESPQS